MKNLVPKSVGRVSFSVQKTLWLYLVIIPIFWLNFEAISSKLLIINFILTILTVCIGHSIGLHRGLIHKTYTSSATFQNILLTLFVYTGLGSAKDWLKMHYFRDVWQNRKDCPKYFQYKHNLLTDYFWNLHLSFTPKELHFYKIPEEDLVNKWIVFLHKTWAFQNIALFLIVYVLTDINTTLFLINFRIGVTIIGHWFIGYVSHKYGYANYEIEDADESAFNNLILGYLSFGEGFHNNHHAFPKSAKLGLKWYEFDLGWYFIVLFQKLKLIHNVSSNRKKEQAHRIVTKWNFPF